MTQIDNELKVGFTWHTKSFGILGKKSQSHFWKGGNFYIFLAGFILVNIVFILVSFLKMKQHLNTHSLNSHSQLTNY